MAMDPVRLVTTKLAKENATEFEENATHCSIWLPLAPDKVLNAEKLIDPNTHCRNALLLADPSSRKPKLPL